MREEHLAGVGGVHVPLLVVGVEADVRGPDDVESSERTEINRLGVSGEGNGVVGGKGSCQSASTKKPAGCGPGGRCEMAVRWLASAVDQCHFQACQ